MVAVVAMLPVTDGQPRLDSPCPRRSALASRYPAGTAAPPGGQFQQRGLHDQPVPRRGASAGRSQPIAVKSGLIS
jgi:hypothetical protein